MPTSHLPMGLLAIPIKCWSVDLVQICKLVSVFQGKYVVRQLEEHQHRIGALLLSPGHPGYYHTRCLASTPAFRAHKSPFWPFSDNNTNDLLSNLKLCHLQDVSMSQQRVQIGVANFAILGCNPTYSIILVPVINGLQLLF